MCTVTVVPISPTQSEARSIDAPFCRVICNRDEQRSRPQALPPVRRPFGDRAAILPIDAQSGGTWLAANDAGITLCLLNANPQLDGAAPAALSGRRSRGEIIPALLDASDLRTIGERLRALSASDFPPFRLLALSARQHVIAASDGRRLVASPAEPVLQPILLTSSGLGDRLVEQPRRELFERLVLRHADRDQGATLDAQETFHTHTWPDHPELSVRMSRADARTVSQTRCTIAPAWIELAYAPIDGTMHVSRTPSVVRLPIHAPALNP